MKSCLNFLFKMIALLLAFSAIIFSVAVFRYEIEEFFESIGEKISGLGSRGRSAADDEYADFADV